MNDDSNESLESDDLPSPAQALLMKHIRDLPDAPLGSPDGGRVDGPRGWDDGFDRLVLQVKFERRPSGAERSLMTDDEASARFERDVLRLLASGMFDAARELLRANAGDSLVVDVARADLRTRLERTDLPELQVLRERVERSASRDRLGPWLDAVIAERLLLDADMGCVVWAVNAVAGIPDSPFVAFPVLYARARLKRIVAVGNLLTISAQGDEAFQRNRDDAITDFLRCDFRAEAAVTRGALAGARSQYTWEDPRLALEQLDQALAELGAPAGSWWEPWLQVIRGSVALQLGDLAAAHDAFDRVDRHTFDAQEPSYLAHRGWTRFGRAMCTLIASAGDPTTLPEVDAAIDDTGAFATRYRQMSRVLIANILADFGRLEAARYARASFDLPPSGGMAPASIRLLQLRIEMLEGVVPDAGEIKELLADVVEVKATRNAADTALRVARDLDRLGEHAEAEALRSWAFERLPPAPQRTLWELLWARPADAVATDDPRDARPRADRSLPSQDKGSPDARVIVRVLEPHLVVEVDGVPVRMGDCVARLLVAVVAAHPFPLHVEQVTEAVWPGAAPHEVRARLNTAVYRARALFRPHSNGIRRFGDLLAFDEQGCWVDLLEHRDALASGRAAGLDAIRRVRGNLCDVQFPYDDRLIDERRSFASTWLHHARASVVAGDVEPVELTIALAALGFDLADVTR